MYLEIDDGFHDHHKTLRLCRLLGDQNAGMYLLRLWTWATRSAPDGDLTGMDPEDVEVPLRWRGEPGACWRALVACGFIDVDDEGGAQIHNWAERTGGAIERMELGAAAKREAATERKRRERDRKAGESKTLELPLTGHADVTRDQSVTVTPVTPLDKARQDETRQGENTQPPRACDPGGPVVVAGSTTAALALVPKYADPCRDLLELYAKVRSELVGGEPWETAGNAGYAKARGFLTEVAQARDPTAIAADFEPTMRLFAAVAKVDKDPRLREPFYGFCAWITRFAGLREELHGRRPAQGKALNPRDAAFFSSIAGGTAC